MAAKSPQNQPVLPADIPSTFNDDLVYRCFPHKFRNVGNPYAYLNDVGITPILEFIYKGHLLIDVAEAVNVPLTVLRTWVENEGHLDAISDAETVSAEGYLAEGMRRLRSAPTEFELRRAKEMVKHAQYMAGKKNKPIYGESVVAPNNAQVTYIFNVPDSKTAANVAAKGGQIIDSTSNRIEEEAADDTPNPVSLNLGDMFGVSVDSLRPSEQKKLERARSDASRNTQTRRLDKGVLAHLGDVPMPEPDTPQPPQPRLVADRPKRPTHTNPDIGPFYEE